MRGIKIRDMVESGQYLAVDLRHVLDALGERAIRSSWKACGVWATGKKAGVAAKLEKLADGKTLTTGMELSRIANNLVQVIDGEFQAFESGNTVPWVVIRAVDSSCYEIFSSENDVLDKVRNSFCEVSDCDAYSG
jgi:hypothetical protein